MSVREALDTLLGPGERVVATIAATPHSPNKSVLYQSLLALTTERVLEVSTGTLSKLGIGKTKTSSASIALGDIGGCDFRQGKLLWKNGGKNVVVVQTVRGELGWATQSARLGQEFAESVRTQLAKPSEPPSMGPGAASPVARTPLAAHAAQPTRGLEAPVRRAAVTPPAMGRNRRGQAASAQTMAPCCFVRRGAAQPRAWATILSSKSRSGARSSTSVTDPRSRSPPIRRQSGFAAAAEVRRRCERRTALDIEKSIVDKVLGRDADHIHLKRCPN